MELGLKGKSFPLKKRSSASALIIKSLFEIENSKSVEGGAAFVIDALGIWDSTTKSLEKEILGLMFGGGEEEGEEEEG